MSVNKKIGKHSQAANDFLQPQTPTNVVATDIGTGRAYNDGAASVAFVLPANSPAATGYTVLSSRGQTATGTSSPIIIGGLGSDLDHTFQVKATNAVGDSAYSADSNSVRITTVPATPAAPTAVTVANQAQDTVTWVAPANGGKAITNYRWTSNDGKSGDTSSTSVTVNQEQGTAQTYNVYATNANGNSETSASSGSVTTFSFTPFSFTPFSVFGFSPFGFSPFGFSPFGFSPFGFSPFGFSPFGFSPFSFSPKSLGPTTLVRTVNGLVEAQNLQVGDQLVSVELPGLSNNATSSDIVDWNTSLTLDLSNTVITTINGIGRYINEVGVVINGDIFSGTHFILVERDSLAKFVASADVLDTDLVWDFENNVFTAITQLEKYYSPHEVITINCEPYDLFFTEKTLTHDGYGYMNPSE